MYMPGKNNCITGIIAYRVVVPIFYDFATLNNNLEAVPQFITDTTGRITGYKTPGGADTVFPFSSVITGEATFNGNEMPLFTVSNIPSEPKMVFWYHKNYLNRNGVFIDRKSVV